MGFCFTASALMAGNGRSMIKWARRRRLAHFILAASLVSSGEFCAKLG
ncbi:hypothetical protein QWZ16_21730 [Vibrio ostreicida]|uniref:DUF3265 domain-containing protein n=1 Tax=Vibrio ostreicida TaxID=526588 RepID=A0ABT8BZT6_9VIBR|nr:hypothetical protein [Vibrio ostreicida]MDN3612219.1 hypothetical protein [Vibrio ostreicida]